MAVKIKLKRLGKKRNPQYRIVVADSRSRRDGRAIEEIGLYHPKEEPSLIRVDSERAQYWLGVGAQPTEAVVAILKVTGDWQKHKNLPGSEGSLKVAAPKVDKREVFAAAAADAAGEKDRWEAEKVARAKAAKEAAAAAAAAAAKEQAEAEAAAAEPAPEAPAAEPEAPAAEPEAPAAEPEAAAAEPAPDVNA